MLKPLGTGAFVNADGQPHAVYTTPLTADISASGDFAAAPFVAQARVDVRLHLRVVTAGPVVATAALDAESWPLDWRVAEEAHDSAGPPLFVDLNPAGQWLFLPEEVAEPITERIVSFLSGEQ